MILPSKRILIVSSNPNTRMTIKNILTQQLGHRNFASAEDGEKAWELIEQSAGSADRVELVLSEWDLPSLNGIDLLIKARSSIRFKNLPFVLVTQGDEPINDAEAAGMSAYIEKPLDGEKLAEKIREAWRKHHGGLDRGAVKKVN